MQQEIPMNYRSLMFDEPGGSTINGIPAGFLAPNAPRLVGADGKPATLDINTVVEAFHGKIDSGIPCVFSGEQADGMMVLDNNPNNFLITNLAPVNAVFMNGLAVLPRVFNLKTFLGSEFDIELEVFGMPSFVADAAFDALQIRDIPVDQGLAEDEANLLWLWNDLTKSQLLKGLTNITMRHRQTNKSVSMTNIAVLEWTMRVLQADLSNKENTNVC